MYAKSMRYCSACGWVTTITVKAAALLKVSRFYCPCCGAEALDALWEITQEEEEQ